MIGNKLSKLGFALAAMAISLVPASRAKAVLVTPIYDPFSNSDLYIVGSTSTTWTQAETAAQALGGNLISIDSTAENAFVANAVYQNLTASGGPDLSNTYALWIGLYDPTGLANNDGHGAQHAANFAWVNGDHSTYRNWNTGEPNNGFFNGGQDPFEYYTSMYGPDATPINLSHGGSAAPTGTWDDIPNNSVPNLPTTGFYGIAAVPLPEPMSTATLLLAAPLLLGRRRVRR